MKTIVLLKSIVLFLLMSACSKENSDAGEEFDLLGSRDKIISKIKSMIFNKELIKCMSNFIGYSSRKVIFR